MIRRAAAALAGASLLGAAADAQSVRGIVFQPDSATRAAGVVVVATDERGDTVARTLSGADGVFDIRVPRAGAYALRLLRVGYRPTVLPSITVPADGVTNVRATLGAEAVRLAAVTVRSDNVCGTTQDAGRVVADLWEEARTALSAAELSQGTRALDIEWQAFQFAMDTRGARARDQTVISGRGLTERPFVSASAAELADAGYVVQDQAAWVYRAPDATALLSGQFAETHCFRVDPPSPGRSQWVGIGFRPTPQRREARDIMGTLWLDRATSELRLLEFRYTNLPPDADDPQVGGYVEYARVSTGNWLVARWAIRMPRLMRRTIGGAAIPGGGRQDRTIVTAIDVTGGEIVRVHGARTLLFDADTTMVAKDGSSSTAGGRPSACGATLRPGGVLTGTVSDGRSGVGGASLSVTWSPGADLPPVTLATVADGRGTYLLPCVARGVPLAVTVVAGGVRRGPLALAALTGQTTLADIDLSALPPGPP
ncbi:MAG TPA: carboxypeptidase-like regulatory domain-containing protein [Gemmatimonadaceae bacterium]|nr:carboxypeptidase-like regulatory domain-containing protein [Gemmatimonadaceae bacterium]